MRLHLKNISFPASKDALSDLPKGKLLINTINAHSYNVAQTDTEFAEALLSSDVLLPDGISIVLAKRLLAPKPPKGELRKKIKKIAGEDLFYWEMNQLDVETRRATSDEKTRRATSDEMTRHHVPSDENAETPGMASVLFLGSSEVVLAKIKARAAIYFPNVEVHTYSPPYKAEFSDADNAAMVEVINTVKPDVLFVGMTAPKQEKWAWQLINNYELRIVISVVLVQCSIFTPKQ